MLPGSHSSLLRFSHNYVECNGSVLPGVDPKPQLRDQVGEVKVSVGVRKQHQTDTVWIIFS